MRIAIVEYGMGNVASVAKALHSLGAETVTSALPDELARADLVVLPGVGSFQRGMEELRTRNLVAVLDDIVRTQRRPFLGICLGMQLTATLGHEPAACPGLGWIDGEVLRMDDTSLPVPHIGWNELQATGPELADFHGADFYFVHSYHLVPRDPALVTAYVEYGGRRVAALRQGNIQACQFHPEKSQQEGLKLLRHMLDSARA